MSEDIARAIDPGAWSLHNMLPKLRETDPFHASKLDMSLAAAARVEQLLATSRSQHEGADNAQQDA